MWRKDEGPRPLLLSSIPLDKPLNGEPLQHQAAIEKVMDALSLSKNALTNSDGEDESDMKTDESGGL